MPTKQLTVREVADRTGYTEKTVRRLIHTGLIRGHQNRPRGPIRVTEAAYQAYLERTRL